MKDELDHMIMASDSLKNIVIRAGPCPHCGSDTGETHKPSCCLITGVTMIPPPIWPTSGPIPTPPPTAPDAAVGPDAACQNTPECQPTTSPSGAHTSPLGPAGASTGGVSVCPRCKGRGWVIKDILSGSVVRCACMEPVF